MSGLFSFGSHPKENFDISGPTYASHVAPDFQPSGFTNTATILERSKSARQPTAIRQQDRPVQLI